MKFPIWDKEHECMPRAKIKELQLERLKRLVRYCYDNSPYYKQKFDENKIDPDKLRVLSDLKYLPFTSKVDMRDSYPTGMFGKPLKDIVRIHASSGTTGKPTVVGYTRADLDNWAEMVARITYSVGANEDTIVQIAFGYGLFTGALGLHYGLEKIGATVIPTSTGNSEKQLMFMRDFKTDTLVSTPSYALYLAELAKDLGYPMSDYNLKLGLLGSEGCTAEMRQKIEDGWGMFVTDNYGLSEVCGPGMSGECPLRRGLHISEDHFICEIIDPITLEPVEEGEEGELVVTTLTKEGIPMLRYRTKDLTRITYEKCECGRTTARMEKIKGRSDDMLKIKGVNVFPSQVESVLMGDKGVSPHYQLVVRREGFTDTLEIRVEITDESILDKFTELETMQKQIRHKLGVVLGLDAKVTLVPKNSIERFQGKAKRVLDLRNENK